MKMFIFLFILIAAFFTYIFTAGGKSEPIYTEPRNVAEIPTLEEIEAAVLNEPTTQTDHKHSSYNTLSETDSSRVHQNTIYDTTTPPIPEYMTFDKFQALLLEINPYYPKSAITLNLPLSSVIRTKSERETFRQKMLHDFHLSEQQVEQLMQEDKLIWDWINLLR